MDSSVRVLCLIFTSANLISAGFGTITYWEISYISVLAALTHFVLFALCTALFFERSRYGFDVLIAAEAIQIPVFYFGDFMYHFHSLFSMSLRVFPSDWEVGYILGPGYIFSTSLIGSFWGINFIPLAVIYILYQFKKETHK